MADFIAQFGGIGLAFLGAALAVGLCCVGSARGGCQKAGRLGVGNYSMRYRGVLRHSVPAGLCIAADERPVRSSTREKGGSK